MGRTARSPGASLRDMTALFYPWAEPPGLGELQEVADGLLWMRLPLPFVLDHVNAWLLRDGEGWTVVDTGIDTPELAEAWDAIFAGELAGAPVTRVVCTHMHPDHIGRAGAICRRFDARLWMTRLEYVTGRMLLADTGRPAPEEGVRFYHAAGWDDPALELYRARFGKFGLGVTPLPDSFRRMEDGGTVVIDGRDWRVVVGSGHSPEHACLYCPELKVLISGDQVLPRISSNVSVFPTEPDADPLGDWMNSLAKLEREIPDDVLVLPSHGRPFRGLHARLGELARGHQLSLDRLERALDQPKRAVDVFGALFARTIGGELLGMATGEALAHLARLERQGRAVRHTGPDGVWRWVRR
ncbi:MAG: MBL fold metallo-hydrolase [Proteobacteria bacterium]|nr:MBL fold metallo-hydrolase [Pseudomonadota bacterium]